jgi:hypothetical protein
MRLLVLLAFFATTAIIAASLKTSTTNAVVSDLVAQAEAVLAK